MDLVHGIITRQGTRLKLQDQPFRILTMLIQRPGEIVTREELRQALWQEGTHVNFDGSLNAALKKLRSCLQDDAENPASSRQYLAKGTVSLLQCTRFTLALPSRA